MGAEQQQSVDFKSWLVFFTRRLCDCVVQTSAVNLELAACHFQRINCVQSFSRIRSPALQNIWPAMLVQQVVLDSHQNLTNH